MRPLLITLPQSRRTLYCFDEPATWPIDTLPHPARLPGGGHGGRAPVPCRIRGIPGRVVDLAHAMTLNHLACPYRTAEYAIEHLAVAPAVRSNVTIAYYDAGHMMYVHPPSMRKFKDDVAAFVDANAR